MALPLLLRGEKLSLLERNFSAGITASQVPDPLYPIARLGDTRPSQLFIFPSRLEDEYFHIDVDQYRDTEFGVIIGGFENWTAGIPDGHTVNVTGTGAVTQEITSPIFAGTSSMQMENGASGTVEVLASIEVLAGDEVELRYAAQTSVASSPATLEVFNPYTGKWLTTTGTWSSRRQNAIESVLTVMDEATLAFTVEAFSAIRNHSVSLELRYHMDSAAATTTHHWDAVRWIPAVDFMSIHAHNMSAGIVPRLCWSDTSLADIEVDRAFTFDGTAWIARTSGLVGAADGKEGTFSCWVKFNGGNGVLQTIFCSDNDSVKVFKQADNTIRVLATNAATTVILNMVSVGTITADGSWHHILASWDLNATTGQLFIDGVSDLAGGGTFTNDNIDYTVNLWRIGVDVNAGTQELEGDLGELYLDITTRFDLSVAANVALFRTSAGEAAVLGDSGELVTGTSPIVYWRGDSKLTNSGTGGDFETETNTITEFIGMAKLTKQDVAFYHKLNAVEFKQFWKFHMRGTNAVNPIEVGLWNLAQSITPPWSPRLQGNEETLSFPQSRAIVEASGEQWAIRKAKHARRSARMRFNLKSTSQASFRDELLARTFQGADPIVLVENQNAPKVVHGRFDPESEFARRSVESELVELIVEESSNGRGIP